MTRAPMTRMFRWIGVGLILLGTTLIAAHA